jgi:hypothetical protein
MVEVRDESRLGCQPSVSHLRGSAVTGSKRAAGRVDVFNADVFNSATPLLLDVSLFCFFYSCL